MIVHSRRSPLDPVRQWQKRAKLAVYHGLDLTGSTDAAVSTLTMDRMLGHRVPLGLGFLGQGSWAGMDTVEQSIGGYVGLRDNVIVSIPMTHTGTTLAAVAAGTFNSYFDTIFAKIAAKYPKAINRIGWEFNGNWYPWSARNVEADYNAVFRLIVERARLASPDFKFLWNPDKKAGRYAHSGYADPPDCYPGDDVVDFIGIDAYDGWVNGVNAPTVNANGTGGAALAGVTPHPIPTQEVRWTNELVGVPDGNVAVGTAKPFCLAWCAEFAAAHDKQIIIPEWATGFDSSRDGENTGDDAYYVARMGEWIEANDVYAHGYWDRQSPSHYNSLISTGTHLKPLSQAAFVEAFGYDEI